MDYLRTGIQILAFSGKCNTGKFHSGIFSFQDGHWIEVRGMGTKRSGNRECEDKIKEDVQATSRCMPFEQEHLSDVCVCCGKPAKKMVYWGRAY